MFSTYIDFFDFTIPLHTEVHACCIVCLFSFGVMLVSFTHVGSREFVLGVAFYVDTMCVRSGGDGRSVRVRSELSAQRRPYHPARVLGRPQGHVALGVRPGTELLGLGVGLGLSRQHSLWRRYRVAHPPLVRENRPHELTQVWRRKGAGFLPGDLSVRVIPVGIPALSPFVVVWLGC